MGCIGVLAAYFCSWGTALYDGHSSSVDWVKFSPLFQNQALSQQQEKVTILCNNSIPLSSNSSLSSSTISMNLTTLGGSNKQILFLLLCLFTPHSASVRLIRGTTCCRVSSVGWIIMHSMSILHHTYLPFISALMPGCFYFLAAVNIYAKVCLYLSFQFFWAYVQKRNRLHGNSV